MSIILLNIVLMLINIEGTIHLYNEKQYKAAIICAFAAGTCFIGSIVIICKQFCLN